MTQILVIDSQRSVRNSLKSLLEHEGYAVDTTETYPFEGNTSTTTSPDLIICGAPDKVALEQLPAPWIALSSDASIRSAVQAVRNGAVDFVPKPVSVAELLRSVRGALEEGRSPAVAVNAVAPSRQKKKSCHAEELLGSSPKMARLRRVIERVAPSEARVLIIGPNGTGKEVVAQQIHRLSNRSVGPFVEVNCAAIPSELIESELFGHEKGAFTSAIKQHKGKFEQAIGGTLFLDEVGDMSLSAQAKVLRVLQERKISRVGSDKDIDVDVRVVAATNKRLREEIAAGRFREDLYHRLGVVILSVPAVSERREDVPQIVRHFLRQVCADYSIAEPYEIEPEAMEALCGRAWSGNIREIRNVVERLVVMCDDPITFEDVKNYVLDY